LAPTTHAGQDSALLCIPGTHCKWIKVELGKIVDFHTVMTGDLYGVSERTRLAGAVVRKRAARWTMSRQHYASFDQGLDLDGNAAGIFCSTSGRCAAANCMRPNAAQFAVLSFRHPDRSRSAPDQAVPSGNARNPAGFRSGDAPVCSIAARASDSACRSARKSTAKRRFALG